MIRFVSSRCGSLSIRLLQPYLYQTMQVPAAPSPQRCFKRLLGHPVSLSRRLTLMKVIQGFFDLASFIEEHWRRIRSWVIGIFVWGATAYPLRRNHWCTRIIWYLVMFFDVFMLCVITGLTVPRTLTPQLLALPRGCVIMLVRSLPGFAQACTHASGAMS